MGGVTAPHPTQSEGRSIFCLAAVPSEITHFMRPFYWSFKTGDRLRLRRMLKGVRYPVAVTVRARACARVHADPRLINSAPCSRNPNTHKHTHTHTQPPQLQLLSVYTDTKSRFGIRSRRACCFISRPASGRASGYRQHPDFRLPTAGRDVCTSPLHQLRWSQTLQEFCKIGKYYQR